VPEPPVMAMIGVGALAVGGRMGRRPH